MADLNFEGLSRLLLSQSRDILYRWLPGGKLVGAEYCCGSLRGELGDSMRVNINKGLWQDFATGDKGGDLVSLYAAINGKSQGEAFRELATEFNFEQNGSAPGTAVAIVKQDEDICQPPAETDLSRPLELFKHAEHGAPSGVWFYKNVDDEVLFAVARYETRKGKLIMPWTWNKRGFWNCKAWPAPRPLYGMEYMKGHTGRMGKRILIVEGEKAAVAARAICGELYVVLTWSNGAQAWSKADFGPIRDLRVLLWGDADKPGAEVMRDKIAPMLVAQKCEVKILDPEGQTEGWDAADALMEGMDWAKFKDWATPRVTLYQRPGVISATAISENDKAIAAAKAELTLNIGEEGAVVTKSQREIWSDLELSMTKSDYPAVNYDNVLRVLSGWPPMAGIAWYDEFHEKIFTKYKTGIRREWTDSDDAKLSVYFQRELGFQKMTKECVGQGIKLYAEEHPQNEPKDWFESLKWDQVERLPKFFHTYFGADDNIYTSQAGMNFWVGMVARVYRPGCKLDNMIVLEGPQGIGKSSSMEVIGGPWYCEASESAQSKDFYMVLQGKLLIEIAELDSFGKADVTRIKQTISCPKDRYRAPYDIHPKDHYRKSIFVGTTNEQSYLKDTTGGRRFWPMFCRKIKNDDLARDREQLFAEAVLHYKQKDEWWHMPRQETLDQQDRRQHIDEWEHVIAAFLDRRVEITAIEIAVECLKIEIGRFDKPTQMRVGAILKHLKWERGKAWREGKTASIWTRRANELVE